MKRFTPALFWAALILALPGAVRVFPQDFTSLEAPDVLAVRILERMTDEQALAQTFMLGWVGAEPSPLIIDWIQDRGIGGSKFSAGIPGIPGNLPKP